MSGAVSVVIAVRDQARYLGEAIDSVLGQSLPPQRLVVVDDASSDGTAEVARSRGVETIVLPECLGPAGARNAGAALIDSEYICFLDGDDRMTPCHNELLLAAIGDAGAAAGRVRQFFDPGREAELSALPKVLAKLGFGTVQVERVFVRRRRT